MNAILIEDETAAVKNLKSVIMKNSVVPVDIIAELESIEESVTYIRENGMPDIIFMDIHLSDGSAFKIFEQVEVNAPVIFTTAYDDYALQAFQVSSVDYLLKPVTIESLERALNKLRLFSKDERNAHISQTNKVIQERHILKVLLIKKGDKFYPVQVEDILYFYTYKEKVTAYTSDGKEHPVEQTLDMLTERLDESNFFRANRQFIIARHAIKDVEYWFSSRLSVNLLVPVPERIVVSKVKTPVLKKWIIQEEGT